ncbi:TrbG/VirB9 family P-type conjugative transfer protein [Allosphingosinicella sp.]|uniref:TrbG/VirB9 family P-type conjugative transfer protein n=1 Tax=Allosphingosinicella sp. TaxID=2823234 RepID=UPI002EE1D66C
MIRALLAALALSASFAGAANAQVRPQPGTGDPRLQSVDYSADQVVLLEVAPGYQMTVELAPDEQIENVAVGDSGAWQVTANRRGDRLFIKPLQSSVRTNMTVITNARVYAMELSPLFDSAAMAYTVRFRYPEVADEEVAEVDQADLVGRYRLSGDRAIRPSGIGDDGQRTYIEWPAERALPAVYGIDSRGQETLVNGQMREGVFVLDTVLPRLIFRMDRQVARAVRIREAAR